MKGFTLFEVLIVVAIMTILFSLTIPLGLSFYRNQQLGVHSQGIVQVLRMAQLKSISAEDDSSFGVYLTNDNYILFKGSSYLTRDPQYDQNFNLPLIINVSGLREIIFSKLEGKPNVSGNIVLISDENSIKIHINEIGTISY